MSKEGYVLTKDWFSWAPETWLQLMPALPARKRFLELGSFEGASMIWTVENMLEDGATIECVDTFAGGEEHATKTSESSEANFDHNRKILANKLPKKTIVKIKSTSTHHLAVRLAEGTQKYDFIYVDASHTAPDVLTDACMAFHLLKGGGILVLDDYLWGDPRDVLHRPKIAIDAFTNIFAEKVKPLHIGYQVALQKIDRYEVLPKVKNA